MSAVLEVRSLVRTFGPFVAVDDVSFSVGAGQICGFIGPNGAGKTTTMRICATLDLPDEGEVSICGRSVLEDPRWARRSLGFMPDAYGAYTNTTVADYLDFFARAYGLGVERQRTIDRLVEFTDLGGMLKKQTGALSKGMKQRLCLAKTMLHDPQLFILDEPAAGLDPRARIELRELVRALADMGKAILISSHILWELGELCDSVVVIEQGRVKAAGSVRELTRGLRADEAYRIFARSLGDPEDLRRRLLEQPRVQEPTLDEDGVAFAFLGDEQALAELVTALVAAGVPPIELRPEALDLEDAFLRLTEGRVQ